MKKTAIILLFAHASAQTCEDTGDIFHVHWDELMGANATAIPPHDCVVEFDISRYQLRVDCGLTYLGNSTDSLLHDDINLLGTTYQIGFDSFTNAQDTIDAPSTCGNRKADAFVGKSFDEWWTYSETPNGAGHIANNSWMAYPEPSDPWTVSMLGNCNPIFYQAVFSWNDLMGCQDAHGNKLIDVNDDGTNINVGGTFYVNIISPHVMGAADSGYYRVYPLVQQDWALTIVKQVNVLSTTGTDLFIISILSIFEDDIDGTFRMIVLTQSADYIKLNDPILVATPFTNPSVTMMTPAGACISSSRYTCGQLFEIALDSAEATCTDGNPADFSGQYQLGFTAECATIGSDVCATFMDDNAGAGVALEVYSNFVDNTCDPQLYTSILTGELGFFDDADFNSLHDPAERYVIGQDFIFVEVFVDFPDDGTGDIYSILEMELVNVFVCTSADAGIGDNLDQVSGAGGCLSSFVDTDGTYNIITNGVGNPDYSGAVLTPEAANLARFSFETFNTGRSTIFVHVQLMLSLADQSGNRRRMLLQTDGGSNQIRHFIDNAGIAEAEAEETDDVVNGVNGTETTSSSLEVEVIATLIALVVVVLVITAAAVWCFYMRMYRAADEKRANLTGMIQANLHGDDRLTPRADRVTSVSAVSMANL